MAILLGIICAFVGFVGGFFVAMLYLMGKYGEEDNYAEFYDPEEFK